MKPRRFTEWRQFSTVKQAAIAEDCGWSQSFQSRVESGVESVPLPKVHMMVRLINLMLAKHGKPRCKVASIIDQERSADLSDVLESVCERAGIPVKDVMGPSRRVKISDARQCFMYIAKRRGWHSYPQIATAVNRKDHTTAMYGARAYAKRHGLPMPEAWC